jgi:hypothetical protein
VNVLKVHLGGTGCGGHRLRLSPRCCNFSYRGVTCKRCLKRKTTGKAKGVR